MKYLKYFENNISFRDKNLTTLQGLKIPKICDYHFNCSCNNLTSLEFCPEKVDGCFWCGNNQLTSLKLAMV